MKIKNPRFRLLLVGCLACRHARFTAQGRWCRDAHGRELDAGGCLGGDRRGQGRGHRATPRRHGRVDEGMEHRPWGQNEGHHHPGGGNGQDRHPRSSQRQGRLRAFRVAGSRRKAVPGYGHYLRRNRLGRRRPMGRVHVDQRHLQEFPHRPLQVQECVRDDVHQRRHLWADRPLLF